MSDFVLIHGSGQNAGCWERVGGLLTAHGHEVTAPDLPKQAPDWGLAEYAAEIARSVRGPETIVVAHSFSGVFLPLVAQHRSCAGLVFLAAVIPEPGRSVREQFGEDPGMFDREWIEAGPQWFDPGQRARLSEEFLFPDCDAAVLPWALGTVDVFDTRHLVTQPAPFTTWPNIPIASIVATGDRTLTADWGKKTTRRVLGREPIEIDAGHCPHVSQPDEVARLLENAAIESARRPGSSLPVIACELSALTGEQRRRRAELAEVLRSRAVGITDLASGYAIHLDPDPATVRQIGELVALEGLCCPFLTMTTHVDAASGRLVLSISGGAGVREFIASQFRIGDRLTPEEGS